MTGWAVLLVVVAATLAFGFWWRSREGRVRPAATSGRLGTAGAQRDGAAGTGTGTGNAATPAGMGKPADPENSERLESVEHAAGTGETESTDETAGSATAVGSADGTPQDRPTGAEPAGGAATADGPVEDDPVEDGSGTGKTGAPARVAPDVSDHLPDGLRTRLGDLTGAGVTLLQLSTTFCAPCRHTRILLADLAQRTEGMRHVEVDLTDHPEWSTPLRVHRTPTTLALDSTGRELFRVGGVPRRDELTAALRPHLP